MKSAVVAILAVASAAVAREQKVVVFDKATAVLKSELPIKPLVQVGHVRAFDAITSKDGISCTVVGGKIVSALPNRAYDVTVEITLVRVHTGTHTVNRGTSTCKLYQVPKGVPVPFVCLCAGMIAPDWNGMPAGYYTTYKFSFTYESHRSPLTKE